MQSVREAAGRIAIGNRFSFRLERTLRVPDDGRKHPLPPTFGAFPVLPVRPFRARLPASWGGGARFFIPIRQWEALWISFEAAAWRPNAVQISSGGVNVLTGEKASGRLQSRPQNYLVCPDQAWLDGFKTGRGHVRQFVAAPLHQGLTVAEQLLSTFGAHLSIRVIESKPGHFPARMPRGYVSPLVLEHLCLESIEMGLGAGGAIEQKVYPDPHGLATWDSRQDTIVEIALLNSEAFRHITGQDPPPSPISAADYTRLGFPWFRLYDENSADTGSSRRLRGVKSLAIRDEPVPTPAIMPLHRTHTSPQENLMPDETTHPDQWCFAWSPPAPGGDGVPRAVALKAAMWIRGVAISVSFLDGEKKVKDRVEEAAQQWVGPKMANLTLVFQKKTDSLIRISFKGRGSSSVVGTTCMNIDKKKPTMNLGWLTPMTPEVELQRVVLHEFGHALGLVHEHQHPKNKIAWDKVKVETDLAGPPHFWTSEQIERNMFAPYAAKETNFSTFDRDSIMLYPIPKTWTTNGFSTFPNKKLSKTDAELIRSLYPWE